HGLAGFLCAGPVGCPGLLTILPTAHLLTPPTIHAGYGVVALAGVLVGVGTRYGSGCTSGHGVCGLSRLSPRSLVATVCFMGAGFLVVYVMRHVL
ncbi:MAG: YeeE/YedE family protein, partial [Limnobacter sp.]|nr:YeeE/YedE family protein [Limnobacter sp.]